MHLADAFIQSDLQWIQSIHVCQHIHSIIIMFITSLVCVCVCVCVSVCSSGFLYCFRMGKSPSCGGFESLLCIDGTFGAFLYVCVCVRRGNDHLEEILNQTPERALWTSSLTETWAFTHTHTHTQLWLLITSGTCCREEKTHTHIHMQIDNWMVKMNIIS